MKYYELSTIIYEENKRDKICKRIATYTEDFNTGTKLKEVEKKMFDKAYHLVEHKSLSSSVTLSYIDEDEIKIYCDYGFMAEIIIFKINKI